MRKSRYTPIQELLNDGTMLYILPITPMYAATSNGYIYSKSTGEWVKMLTTFCKRNGYQISCLTLRNAEGRSYQKTFAVSRLVYMAINGPIPRKIDGEMVCVDHISGIKTDNSISNLQLMTNSENLRKGFKDRAAMKLASIQEVA